MSLKKYLLLFLLLFLGAYGACTVLQQNTSRQIQEMMSRHHYLLNGLVGKIFEMNLLKDEAMLQPSARVMDQWHSVFEQLARTLPPAVTKLEWDQKHGHTHTMEEIELLSEEEHNLNDIGITFHDLLQTTSLKKRIRLQIQLNLLSHQMVRRGLELLAINHHNVTRLQNKSDRLQFLAISILALLGSLLFIIIMYRTGRPLEQISKQLSNQNGANLNFRLRIGGGLEINRFVDSFNNMMDQLSSLTTSKQSLDAEILSRKKTEEQLTLALTKLSDAHKHLKQSQAQLIQAEKLSSVGTLAAGVAHELNNPLMGILNFIEYARLHAGKKEKIEPVLLDAEEQVQRCTKIVNNLLTFSRARSFSSDVGSVIIEELLERVIRLLDYRLSKDNISLTRVNWGTTAIWANHSEIQQIFLNILTNSIDAVHDIPDKKITITLQNTTTDTTIIFTDNGYGIAEEHMDKIFDPFFTTKKVGEGTGLGLAIVKNIVSTYNGNIIIESGQDKGTATIISFPLYNSANTTLEVTT